MSFKLLNVPFDVKAVKQGRISGYASVFGNVDLQNEIMAPGCFDACLADMQTKGRKLPILWQHHTDLPLGVFDVLKPDAKGLWVEGNLLIDSVALAKEAAALAEVGAVSGFSIGHFPKQSTFDRTTGIRTITESELGEVSLVTFPANTDARVEAVKLALSHGSLPSLPEFEKILREVGFSKTQAAVVANRGLAHLLQREAEPPAKTSARDLVQALKAFSLPK